MLLQAAKSTWALKNKVCPEVVEVITVSALMLNFCFAGNAPASQQLEDGPGKYKLLVFVSHMGANTACGHYVCHMFKEGRWVIYNDDKVAVSENPPIDLGYLYLFKREDVA